jgi:hypothetical protein
MKKNRAVKRMMPALAAGLLFTVTVHAQADKGILDLRQDRLARAAAKEQAAVQIETEVWTPQKILINLDARCPVVTALGYFGAYGSTDKDPAKAADMQKRFAALQATAQPIAAELVQMGSANKFVGPVFPDALTKRLAVLKAQLTEQISKLYGDASLAEFQKYLAAQSSGVVVGMSGTSS